MRLGEVLEKLGPILLLGMAGLIAASLLKGQKAAGEKPRSKRPLTEREQAMFFRLQEAMPDLVVMPQVAMSALLTARKASSRNTFDRKVMDFVLCTKAFEVVCVIELDDASHRGKEKNDATRDTMLNDAGYKTARFKNVPDAEPLRKAIHALQEPTAPKN